MNISRVIEKCPQITLHKQRWMDQKVIHQKESDEMRKAIIGPLSTSHGQSEQRLYIFSIGLLNAFLCIGPSPQSCPTPKPTHTFFKKKILPN